MPSYKETLQMYFNKSQTFFKTGFENKTSTFEIVPTTANFKI